MLIQETLIIVKPDGLAKGLVGQILCALRDYDLHIIDAAYAHLSKEWVLELYVGEEQEVYFKDLVNWVSSAPVLLLKIKGRDAVSKVKWDIIGRYPNGIRGKYSEDWIKNVAHAPDSVDSSIRELKLANQIFEGSKIMDSNRLKGKMIFALTGMSECGKSTVGMYLGSCGIPRLKIVKLFGKIRDKLMPGEDLPDFVKKQESLDPFKLWDAFVDELLLEMELLNADKVSIESLYGGGLGPYLKQKLTNHFCIIFIDIPLEIRLERQVIREDLTSLDEAKEILIPRDEIKKESGIPELLKISGEVIDNSGSLDDLYVAVDEILAKY